MLVAASSGGNVEGLLVTIIGVLDDGGGGGRLAGGERGQRLGELASGADSSRPGCTELVERGWAWEARVGAGESGWVGAGTEGQDGLFDSGAAGAGAGVRGWASEVVGADV